MKLTRCANGHFYDTEKYSSCPHCQEMNSSATTGAKETDDTIPVYAKSYSGNSREEAVTEPLYNNGGNNGGTIPTWPTTPNEPSDEGKTVGFMAWKEPKKTEGASQAAAESNGIEPVVGWLVCTEGVSKGKSFNLYCGKNFIGRASEMDICLAGDATVSRMRHATIIYEPKEKVFFAQPGESKELFYLNDNVVLSNVQLKDRDVITVGKTTLVFVPFCNSDFGWGK